MNPAFALPPLPDLPFGVETTLRVAESGTTLLYILNHNAAATHVSLSAKYFDLLSGAYIEGEAEIEAYGVWILRLN